MLIGGNRKIKRDKANGTVIAAIGWLTTILMTVAATLMLVPHAMPA